LNIVRRLDERFGDQALQIVRSDPYQAANEVPGIGFLTADNIARKIGLAADSPARIRAAVTYVLKERCEVRGHSYLPSGELVRDCLGFLNRDATGPAITAGLVALSIKELAAAGSLVLRAANAVYVRETHDAEIGLAGRLRELARWPVTTPARLEAVLKSAEAEAGIAYAPEQREAIRMALTHPVVVLTGGPGTGKSTVIRGVLTALRSLSQDDFVSLLAAPTGRAAKRLAEIVDGNASTIHRLLEFSPEAGAFVRNAGNTLEGDLLVVDEASMMDLFLSHALFQAVPFGMRVLLVGDADQLPSIGVGNVFADLIRSGAVPVVRLSHVFRQAEMSRIVTNAHRVNQGRLPLLDRTADFEFVPIEDEAGVAEYIRSSALALSAAGLTVFEINVLTPMRKTETGVAALNRVLQEALNPPTPRRGEVAFGEALLRVGDKVMQIRNNYRKNVFNGDLGAITEIHLVSDELEGKESDDDDEERIVVDYGEDRVAYSRGEWDQLVLAYATTVHKSQGSEYRGVVLIPVVKEHHVMLQRNLLYTAITRARDRVVLVGQLQAIRHAVTNIRSRLRYSRLAERLRAS
jgi:exodeoxyribonuclease V alpha subunit